MSINRADKLAASWRWTEKKLYNLEILQEFYFAHKSRYQFYDTNFTRSCPGGFTRIQRAYPSNYALVNGIKFEE